MDIDVGHTPTAQITSDKKALKAVSLYCDLSACFNICHGVHMLHVSSDVSPLLIREPLWDTTLVPHFQYLSYFVSGAFDAAQNKYSFNENFKVNAVLGLRYP